jgi:heme A synthase
LLGASVVGVILQITLGGVVRVTGSGDGCPDWPQCFGRWIPPAEYHAILEWSHRTTGTIVGIIIIIAIARVLTRYRSHRPLLSLTLSGLVLIAIVGWIGGRVVLNDLDPAIRTLHLGLAEIVLLLQIGALAVAAIPLATRTFSLQATAEGKLVFKLATVAAVISLIALLSGAYAVWKHAGSVCGSWPLCGGPIIPEVELMQIHMLHRVAAGVGVIVAAYAAHKAFRLPGATNLLKTAALTVAITLAAQVLMGALNPWTDFATWTKASHLSLATLVWAATASMAVLLWLPNRNNES